MKNILKTILFSFLLIAFTACDSGNPDSKDRAEEQNEERLDDTNLEKDAEFAVEAALGGMLEVQLGALAQSQAVLQETKDLATMMVNDHQKSNEELMALAEQKNIVLPQGLSDDKRKKLDDFREKTGEEFDKDYYDFLVDHHEKTIDKYEDQAENGKDADLKSWASKTIPVLQNHLQMAKQLKEGNDNMDGMNKENNTNSENNNL